jgi:hypothetical protein
MNTATTTSAATSAPKTAFIMKDGDKFACVVDNERVSTSKHEDYVEYHLRRGDVKALKDLAIEKIAYVDEQGTVTRIVDAEHTPRRQQQRAAKAAGTPAAAANVPAAPTKIPAAVTRGAKAAAKALATH